MALPPELLEKLQELHDKITDIEDAVDPLLEVPYEEHCQVLMIKLYRQKITSRDRHWTERAST